MYKSNKHKVLDQDYETIINITDKTKEKHYIKKKTHLYTKFNNLKNATLTTLTTLHLQKK